MSVKLVRCEEGHIFDQAKSQICPTCGAGVASSSKPPIAAEKSEDNNVSVPDNSSAFDKTTSSVKGARLPSVSYLVLVKFVVAFIAGALVVISLISWGLTPDVEHQAKNIDSDMQTRTVAETLSLSNSARVALEVQTAYLRYRKGEYDSARETFEQLAEAGAPLAQYYLADIFAKGLNAKIDEAAAVRLLKQSADSGTNLAQFALGHRYETGTGVDQDMDKARQYYILAALQKYSPAEQALQRLGVDLAGIGMNINAMYKAYESHEYAIAFPRAEELAKKGMSYPEYLYGLMCYFGYGTEKNEKEALYWWRSSAEKSMGFAQWRLGHLYADGKAGIQKNIGEAAVWFRLSWYNTYPGPDRDKLKQDIQKFWPQVPPSTEKMIDVLLPPID